MQEPTHGSSISVLVITRHRIGQTHTKTPSRNLMQVECVARLKKGLADGQQQLSILVSLLERKLFKRE